MLWATISSCLQRGYGAFSGLGCRSRAVGGHYVVGTFTRVSLQLSGFTYSGSGQVVFRQEVGNPWRGTAEGISLVDVERLTNGEYNYTIPIYDFASPLRVSILDEVGSELIRRSIDLRQAHSQELLTVFVGRHRSSTANGVFVEADELPANVDGYDGVRVLWIGQLDRPINQANLQAIYRWVLAGGTVMLFTGEHFPIIDSPLMRSMLPLRHPVVQLESGTYSVVGDLRDEAKVILKREDLFTVYSIPLGTGKVVLVDRSALSVGKPFYNLLTEIVTGSTGMMSLETATEQLLSSTTLNGPSYVFGLSFVGVYVLVCGVVCRISGGRKRLVFLVSVATIAVIMSGLYLNRTKPWYAPIQVQTSITLQDQLGMSVIGMGVFNPVRGLVDIGLMREEGLVECMPRDLSEANYEVAHSLHAETNLWLEQGDERVLRGYGSKAAGLKISYAGDEVVEISSNVGEFTASEALVVVGGVAYPIGEIYEGRESYVLTSGVDIGVSEMQRTVALLYEIVKDSPALKHGTWLVAGYLRNSQENVNRHEQKVRDVSLYVVKGDSSDHAF